MGPGSFEGKGHFWPEKGTTLPVGVIDVATCYFSWSVLWAIFFREGEGEWGQWQS